MSAKQSVFSAVLAQIVGKSWNNELLIFAPTDKGIRSFVARCMHIENTRMIIEKKNGEIAIISLNDYKEIRPLTPKKVVEKPEVV
jgi:hypothetical protein